jgi:diguanylate cyclase (GGDEF)-like protein
VRASGKLIGPVTVSIGVASFGFHGTNGEQLLRSADAALYRAKGEGRDRVVLAE